ncbi:MAG: hypothetical protein FWC86_04270, partial [Coriobacteriia bacterium]|nr:hypothetical protein [Coriobacteriia bacterium]
GELNMKRTIVILALVTAFVFAFATVAQATFRGFTPIRNQAELDAGILQGFITFPEARLEMQRNFAGAGDFGILDPGAQLQNTAHGGYVTTTTKCVVCHSAHRASGVNDGTLVRQVPGSFSGNNITTETVPAAAEGSGASTVAGAVNLANVQNQLFLTAGAVTCEGCHVNTGGQASRLLVEWGGPYGTYTGGGPHGSPARGCTMCHNAGIHGASGSSFNVMNVFMLGNTRGQIRGATPTVAETRDEQIIREVNEGRVLRGGTLDIPLSSMAPGQTFEDRDPTLRVPAGSGGNIWWYNGTRALGPIGGLPTGFTGAPNGNQFGAARSLATAYTCGEAGCHVASAMFNLNWGMGYDRVNYTRNANADNSLGATVPVGHNSAGAAGTSPVTGHVMPSVRATGGINSACGPCHAGNPAGFPTASTVEGRRDDSRRAYGCDQCHDMVGVATNSTAWPHGNRNIVVYEWLADGSQRENTAGQGNLWMYGGSIARARVNSETGATNSILNNSGVGSFQTFRQNSSVNGGFADQSWMVLTGIGSGRYGLTVNRPAAQTWSATPLADSDGLLETVNTGLTDGACLKCHVAIDSASMAAAGSIGADALRHAWRGPGGALNGYWDGVPIAGQGIESSRLFLYR